MAVPFLIIYSCEETVTEVEYLDIDYAASGFTNVPRVVANPGQNINIYVSNLTKKSARLNFSQKYSGNVKYTVMGTQ